MYRVATSYFGAILALILCLTSCHRLDKVFQAIPEAINPNEGVVDPNEGGGEEEGVQNLPGCFTQLSGGLTLMVDGEGLVKLDSEPVPFTGIPLVFDGNQVTLVGSQFPNILLTELSESADLQVNGDLSNNNGVGTYDPSSGAIQIDGFQFVVKVLGKGNASVMDTITMPEATFTTGPVTATGNHDPISLEGSALDLSTLHIKLVVGLTIPTGTLLDSGGIGGGALAAVFEGQLDRNPTDVACQSEGFNAGSPKLVLRQFQNGTPQEIAGDVFRLPEVFTGEGRYAKRAMRLINEGPVALEIQSLSFATLDPRFSVAQLDGSDLTTPLTIESGASVDLRVRFRPHPQDLEDGDSQGKVFQNDLHIMSNDPDRGHLVLHTQVQVLRPGPRATVLTLEEDPETAQGVFVDRYMIDFGTISYSTQFTVPETNYRILRVYNSGVEDLWVTGISPLVGEFKTGAIRYGAGVADVCQDTQNPVENVCSTFLPTEESFAQPLLLPPADPRSPETSPHLDLVLSYQPSDFNDKDQSVLQLYFRDEENKYILLVGHADVNVQAEVKLYVEEAVVPAEEGAEASSRVISIANHRLYNFKKQGTSVPSREVKLYIQNGGATGGNLLKINPADVVLEGDPEFSLDVSGADAAFASGIEAPAEASDGRLLLGVLKFNSASDSTTIKKATLRIPAKGLSPQGNQSTNLEDFQINIFSGLPDGDFTFKLIWATAGIKSPRVTAPIYTNPDANEVGKAGVRLSLDSLGTFVLPPVYSSQPNFQGSPPCEGSPAQRRACAEAMAPIRIGSTSLASGWSPMPEEGSKGICVEGNYNGQWEGPPAVSKGECSYFVFSIAGKEGTDFSQGVLQATNPLKSEAIFDPETGLVKITLKDVMMRLVNSEHSFMNHLVTGYFDQEVELSLSTGAITSDLTVVGEESYPPLESDNHASNNINQAPLDVYICDGQDDGDTNPGDCVLPEDRPANTGALKGRDWNPVTGDLTLVGVTKFTDQTTKNGTDDFYNLIGESAFYIVLKGKICGEAVGVSCD